MNYTYIKEKAALRTYLQGIRGKGINIIALDIEAESNLHAYGEKLCLIQIYDGTDKVLIDPMRIDGEIIRTLLESRDIMKVMYDASSDLSLLKNSTDMEIKSILDLRPAVELLNYEKKDLHSIIFVELGIALEKKSKYQRHNWMNRPIAQDALEYALNDVLYLLALKEAILKKIIERKLLDIYLLKNLQVQNKDYTRNPGSRYGKISGYNSLRDGQKGIFQKVYDIRDKNARLHDVPPHNVINNADLINIAKDLGYIDELHFPRKFSVNVIQKIIGELKAVKKNSPGN